MCSNAAALPRVACVVATVVAACSQHDIMAIVLILNPACMQLFLPAFVEFLVSGGARNGQLAGPGQGCEQFPRTSS